MRGERISISKPIVLVVETCYSCGVSFGMVEEFKQERVRDGHTFYCPAGHGQCYRSSLVERAEKAEKEARSASVALAQERERNQLLANDILDKTQEMQRLQKRVGNGVCPHCHRTFQQLARHMKSKHTA